MKKICFVVSSEMTITAFLLKPIAALSRLYEMSVVVNTLDTGFLQRHGIGARVFPVSVVRRVSPLDDLRALSSLVHLFREHRFDAVHSVSPKAGFLAALAGVLSRVPVRTHTFTGQVWVTRRGLSRFLLKSADKVLAFLVTHILVDSHSQRDFLLAEKVIQREKSAVLANGSISGVDEARFRPDPEARSMIRRGMGIPESDTLILFLGRMNRDKGVLDLAEAFSRLRTVRDRVHLVFVGPEEEGVFPRIREICASCANAIRHVDSTDVPERYMAAADMLCLPSYREGFGSVIIEAAATGIPAIATRIYGVTDAIEEGVTGLLHDAGNVGQLTDRMARLAGDPAQRRRMGEDARVRALRDFSQERVTTALLDHYRVALEGGRSRPC